MLDGLGKQQGCTKPAQIIQRLQPTGTLQVLLAWRSSKSMPLALQIHDELDDVYLEAANATKHENS